MSFARASFYGFLLLAVLSWGYLLLGDDSGLDEFSRSKTDFNRDIDGDNTLSGRSYDDRIEVKRLETTVVGYREIAESH